MLPLPLELSLRLPEFGPPPSSPPVCISASNNFLFLFFVLLAHFNNTLIGGSCSKQDSAADLPYASFTWTQSVSGYFDLFGSFYNASTNEDWDYSYIALYQGSIKFYCFLCLIFLFGIFVCLLYALKDSLWVIPAATNFADPCNETATGAPLLKTSRLEDRAVALSYIWLNQSVTYTVALSGDANDNFAYLFFLYFFPHTMFLLTIFKQLGTPRFWDQNEILLQWLHLWPACA